MAPMASPGAKAKMPTLAVGSKPACPAPAAGFTLIELLVVIAIIAILAALLAGGIAKIRTGQQTAAAEQTVNKIQIALDQ